MVSLRCGILNLFSVGGFIGLLGLAGCEPENVREEKMLRRQLTREIHNHAYETAVPIARKLVQMQPQDSKLWKRLVQAQISLHDIDGAKQTLVDWRARVQPPPTRADLFEGDIAR